MTQYLEVQCNHCNKTNSKLIRIIHPEQFHKRGKGCISSYVRCDHCKETFGYRYTFERDNNHEICAKILERIEEKELAKNLVIREYPTKMTKGSTKCLVD